MPFMIYAAIRQKLQGKINNNKKNMNINMNNRFEPEANILTIDIYNHILQTDEHISSYKKTALLKIQSLPGAHCIYSF